jgi:hypothetical protein
VNEKVLSPVFQILRLGRPIRVLSDPLADVLGKPLVELIEVPWNDEPVVPYVVPVNDCERLGSPVFNRKIGEIDRLILNCGGIALHGDISLERI